MEIKLRTVEQEKKEYVEIGYHRVTEEVREIVAFVKSRQGLLSGNMDGSEYGIPISDIYYIESTDNKCFIYGEKNVYETKERLYELQELLKEKRFLRISKSTLLNLMKVTALKPALNSRFIAVLQNGEEIIISRKYVSDLKKEIKGERQ